MRPYETNGEHLATYLRDHYFDGRDSDPWNRLGMALLASNRSEDWVTAIREMTTLQLCRRLITGGVALVEDYGVDGAESEMKQLIIDTMVVHWSAAGAIYERLLPAVRSSLQPLNDSNRREARSLTRREMPYCYLCGVDLDFQSNDHRAFTLDHVWPRAYGGNSDLENLLGACSACNEVKGDHASWAMYPIQSLVVRADPGNLERLTKPMRMSAQARSAARLAYDQRMSLRDAFIALGRPGVPVPAGDSVAVDVFTVQFTARSE